MNKISIKDNKILDRLLISLQVICLAIVFSGMWLHHRHEKLLIIPLIVWGILSFAKYGYQHYLHKVKNDKITKYLLASLIIVNIIDTVGYGFLHSTFTRGTLIIFFLSLLYNDKYLKDDRNIIITSMCILPSIIYCIHFYYINSSRPELVNPNSFALLFSILSLYFIFSECKIKRVILLKAFFASLSISCVIIMYSRAAFFSLLFSTLLVLLVKYLRNLRKLTISVLILSMTCLIAYESGFTDKLVIKTERQLTTLGKNMDTADGHRLQSYLLGYKMIKEKPILGWGNEILPRSEQLLDGKEFTNRFKLFFVNSTYPHFHNIYIDTAVRFGLITLSLLLLAIGGLIKKACQEKNHLHLGYIIFFAIIGLFDSIFIFGTSLILLATLVLISRKDES